jgi:arabinofuranan 3-O-arabinosyltransferase
MFLPPTLIDECESGLKEHQALVIPEVSVGSGFWAKCKAAERRQYVQGDDLVEAARCFQRDALISLGGYNTQLEAGEDWDLQSRARGARLSIGRVQAKIVHDEGDLTLSAILKKKYAYGRAIGNYLRLSPHVGAKQIDPFRRVLSPSLKVFSEDPLQGAGVLIMRTLEFASAGVGRLRGGMTRKSRPRSKTNVTYHTQEAYRSI